MAIKLEMLRYFRAAAELGSLSEAANAVGRTPSAVSMMLRQFEDELGAALFETGRKSRLTPLGEAVYTEVRRELDHFDRTVDRITALSRAEMGLVRIAATPSLVAMVLPDIIANFLREYPGVRIDLRDMNSAAVLTALEQDEADIGLATMATAPTLDSSPFLTDRFGLVCRTDHPLAQDWDSLTWADLAEVDFIDNDLCGLIRSPDFMSIRARSRLSAPNTASLLALVRAGLGVTVLPELVARANPIGVTFLPLADPLARRDVSLICQPAHRLGPVAAAFARQLLAVAPARG